MLKQIEPITAGNYQSGIASPVFIDQGHMPVHELRNSNKQEMIDFLSVRPVHTVVMVSFIKDNGVESELNRGKFYGYRDAEGRLEGVALIGHSTLVEARSDEALRALAVQARYAETPIHLIMSSGTTAERFWELYNIGASRPRMSCVESLFEIGFPFQVQKSEVNVEKATMEHLMQAAEAQAEVAFIESGVDPMVRDREGFLKRVARRIEQGRIFAAFDNGEMIFKADVIAETDNVVYLEGVWVAPEYRGRGIGSVCLSMLSLELLERVENICLLSNIRFDGAHKSFVKAGFRNTDECTTLFV